MCVYHDFFDDKETAITEFEEVIETLKDIELTCGDITIGDISTLMDYLFITGPSLGLPDCS